MAKEFVLSVYQVTSNYPASERFGLSSQLRRAALSVYSNISEGSSRSSKKEQTRFYEAYGSMMEVIAQLMISVELGFLDSEKYTELRKNAEKVTFMINQLRSAILKKP